MRFTNLFMLFAVCTVLFSCSKDELDEETIFDSNAKLLISEINATSVVVTLESETANADNLRYGIRKKGESEFEEKGIANANAGTFISDLEPAQFYEITLLVGGKVNKSFEIKSVTTLPFDSIRGKGFSASGKNYYAEYEGEYTFEIDIYNNSATIQNNFKLFLSDTLQTGIKIDLDFKITNKLLTFQIPSLDALNVDPYTNTLYYLNCELPDGTSFILKDDAIFENEGIILDVYPNKPYFKNISTLRIETNARGCNFNKSFSISFYGNFLGQKFFDEKNKISNKTIILTKLDTGEKLFFTDDLEDEFGMCMRYYRTSLNRNLNSINGPDLLSIQFPESESLGFTLGTYKIKMNFDVDGEYFETNEFEFELKNIGTIAGKKYKLRFGGVRTDGKYESSDFSDCELMEYYNFYEDGSFNYQRFSDTSGECINEDNVTGTWKEIPQENLEIIQYELIYNSEVLNSKQHTFTLTGGLNFSKKFEEVNSEGKEVITSFLYGWTVD